MKKIFIFDLDGTLVNTLPDIRASLNFALRQLGSPEVSPERCAKMVGNGAYKLCERAAESAGCDVDELFKVYKARYAGHIVDFAKPYDGIPELLRELAARGVASAVMTNKPDYQARPVIEKLFGDGVFCDLWAEDGVRPKKPDARLMEMYLEHTGLCRDEVVYIGDSDVDMIFAANAGVFSVGASWGFRGEAELRESGAGLIARTPADILKAL